MVISIRKNKWKWKIKWFEGEGSVYRIACMARLHSELKDVAFTHMLNVVIVDMSISFLFPLKCRFEALYLPAIKAMASMDIPTTLIKDFDQIMDKRVEKYQILRERNNTTSCRSPTRGLDTKSIKDMLQHKRHLEFQRRRLGGPQLYPERTVKSIYCSTKTQLAKTGRVKRQSHVPVAATVDEQNQTTSASKGGPTVVLVSNSIGNDDQSPSKCVSLSDKSAFYFLRIQQNSVTL